MFLMSNEMGVIYKLKSEIVDFIVNEKKTTPRLSCREMVSIVEQKFQIKVSKSSVNDIFKQFELSGPLGRKPLVDKNLRKFQIPEEKKNQLFKSALSDQSTKTKEEEKRDKISEDKKPENSILSHLAYSADQTKIENIHPKNNFSKEKELSRLSVNHEKETGTDILYDGLGSYFLKAAEWELDNTSILGKLIKKYIDPDYENDIDQTSEILLFLLVFGIQDLKEINFYKQKGLWVVNDLENSIDVQRIHALVNSIKNIKNFSLKFFTEILYIFSEIAYLKIFLEDKTELFLDPQYHTLWTQTEIFDSLPTKKAIFNITHLLITNNEPFILYRIPEKEKFSSQIFHLIAAFENLAGKGISQITMYNENIDEVVRFHSIPAIKRFFILGGWMEQQEIKNNLQKKIEFQYLGKYFGFEVSFAEKSLDLQDTLISKQKVPVRAIFLRKFSQKKYDDEVIFTNLPNDIVPAREVAMKYLSLTGQSFWGQDEIRGIASKERKEHYENTKISGDFFRNALEATGKTPANSNIFDIWDVVFILLLGLNKYCQRHFFPSQSAKLDLSSMQNRFYSLPGYIRKNNEEIEVILKAPPTYSFRKEAQYAVNKLNQRMIKNHDGLRLKMTIG